MDWYYKAGLALGLIWATARALGVYGEAERDLDINFLFGFLVTTGGWAGVFLIIDRVAKFFGWKRTPPDAVGAEAAPSGSAAAESTPAANPSAPNSVERPSAPSRRSSRRPRR